MSNRLRKLIPQSFNIALYYCPRDGSILSELFILGNIVCWGQLQIGPEKNNPGLNLSCSILESSGATIDKAFVLINTLAGYLLGTPRVGTVGSIWI